MCPEALNFLVNRFQFAFIKRHLFCKLLGSMVLMAEMHYMIRWKQSVNMTINLICIKKCLPLDFSQYTPELCGVAGVFRAGPATAPSPNSCASETPEAVISAAWGWRRLLYFTVYAYVYI